MIDKDMMKALEADGEKLHLLTGEDHGPYYIAEPDLPEPTAIEGLNAAIRGLKLALFILNKSGAMPNDSWRLGFDRDLETAEKARAVLQSPDMTKDRNSKGD